jgi:hypothetical protein
MILSRLKQFVYWHIPKTAGISIRALLEQYTTTKVVDYKSKFDSLTDPLHINQQDFLKLNFDEIPSNYFEFVVVRNPLDRLVSMYNYGHNSKKFGSFSNFAQRVAQHYQHPTMSNFYNSQLDWIKQPITDRLQIYKLETLEQNLAELCIKINIDNQPLMHYNKSINVTDKLSTREVEFCRDFLAEEYEILNYQGEVNE